MDGFSIGMAWWMVFGGILFILFWALVIALIVWIIHRVSQGSGAGTPGRPNALDIAKERYARGEITKEQFEQIKKDLSG